MGFIIRLVEAVSLGLGVFLAILIALTLVVFIVNRGLQLFFQLFGYEVGDFFGWFMKKIGFKKIEKKETKINEENVKRREIV